MIPTLDAMVCLRRSRYNSAMDFPVELPFKHERKAKDLKIDPSTIEEAFIRGSGSGGQKINKTSSCVWLKHAPTGIEVKVQRHRERSANRLSAYKLLIDKIEEKIKGHKSERSQKAFKIARQKARRTRKSKEKMLTQKHKRSEIKSSRKPPAL
jgi:peptide chain release factor